MASKPVMMPIERMATRIHLVRGQRIMLDSDLAAIYGVPTMRLNEQLRRNLRRFPEDFAFQLTRQEFATLISQIAISKKGRGGRRKLPWVFTEHGALMLAGILNSQRAVEMSVFVVRAFVQMREMLMSNQQLAAQLDELEKQVAEHDETIAELFAAIRRLLNPPEPPRREIGFHIREVAPHYRFRPAKRF